MEMKFFMKIAGYTLLDLKTNKEIFGGLGVESVENKIKK